MGSSPSLLVLLVVLTFALGMAMSLAYLIACCCRKKRKEGGGDEESLQGILGDGNSSSKDTASVKSHNGILSIKAPSWARTKSLGKFEWPTFFNYQTPLSQSTEFQTRSASLLLCFFLPLLALCTVLSLLLFFQNKKKLEETRGNWGLLWEELLLRVSITITNFLWHLSPRVEGG